MVKTLLQGWADASTSGDRYLSRPADGARVMIVSDVMTPTGCITPYFLRVDTGQSFNFVLPGLPFVDSSNRHIVYALADLDRVLPEMGFVYDEAPEPPDPDDGWETYHRSPSGRKPKKG